MQLFSISRSPMHAMISTEEDYHRDFDSEDYLAGKYQNVDKFYHETLLRGFHEFYSAQTDGAKGLKILEIGCGPVIAYQISAAPFASEIVMADLVESNRDAVQQWLDKSPNAHDWTPFFRYVVRTLEGKGEEEVARREEQLRKAIKAVVYCNALDERLVPQDREGPYDVILESSIFCVISNSGEEYSEALVRAAKYLKPGGWLVSKTPLVEGLREPTHYYTGGCYDPDKPFVVLNVTEEMVRTTWERAGFTDIKISRSPTDPGNRLTKEGASYSGIAFISAIKSE